MKPSGSNPPQLRKLTIFLCLLGVVVLANGRRQGKWIPSPRYAGPYRIVIYRVGNESEDYNDCTGDIWGRLHTTQVRGKQPQYGWGYAYATIPLTDDMKIEATLASRSNNQWKKNAFVFKVDRACSNAKLHSPSFLQLFYGQEYDCPFPAIGLRKEKNRTFEVSFSKFPVMPFGRYLFTMALFKEKTCVGLIVADAEALPRP